MSNIIMLSIKETITKYDQLFGPAGHKRISNLVEGNYVFDRYSEELNLLAGDKNDCHKLAPPGLHLHRAMAMGVLELFGYSFDYSSNTKDWQKRHLSSVKEKYIDNVNIYWLGYLAFLECLQSDKVQPFQDFLNTFKDKPIIWQKYKNYGGPRPVEYNQLKLGTEGAWLRYLESFFVYYTLDIALGESEVNVATRVKALKLWQKLDPEHQWFLYDECRYADIYGYYRQAKLSYISPRSQIKGQNPDQMIIVYNYRLESRNDEAWQKLITEAPAELVQLIRSSLTQGNNHRVVLELLFKLANRESACAELYFGNHASYRNDGKVTKVFDIFADMDRQSLQDTVRRQQEELKELKRELVEAKQEHQQFKASHVEGVENVIGALLMAKAYQLLAQLTKPVDPNGWLLMFGVNPLLDFKRNKLQMKLIYQSMVKTFHPDKHLKDKTIEMTEKMQVVNQAYQQLSNKLGYNKYVNECLQRAYALAKKH